MSNTLINPTVVARDGIMRLENNLVAAGLVYRDFENLPAGKGDTINVVKPPTFVANEFNGSAINIQAVTEGSVPVKLDTILDVSFEVSDKDLTLSVDDFGVQFLEPAMAAIAQGIDEMVLKLYQDIPYSVNVGGSPGVADIINVSKVLDINRAPARDRALVLSPSTKAKYVGLDAFLHADKRGGTDGIADAEIGHALGFNAYMDQNVVNHVEGDLAATATLTGSAGERSGAIAVGGNAKTIKRGDRFTITGITEGAPSGQFVCTEAMTTSAGGTGTLKFWPALPSSVSGAVITVVATGEVNLGFHRNAFALITRPLSKPLDGGRADVVHWKGLSLRVVYAHDISAKKNVVSVDTLVAAATLTPELACRLNNA